LYCYGKIEIVVFWKNDKPTNAFTLFSKSGFTKRLMEEVNQRDNVYLFAAKDIDKLFKNQNNPFV